MKKYRRSPLSIVCYVLAAIFAANFILVISSTLTEINQYYATYGMQPGFGEVLRYMLQMGSTPLFTAVATFMVGIIFNEIRKQNPANWAADEEISEAKEAQRLFKDAKQIAKGEAAKAAAEAKEPVITENDEGIKTEFSAVVAENSDTVEFGGDETEEEAAAPEETENEEPAEAADDQVQEETESESFSDEFSAVVAEDEETPAEASEENKETSEEAEEQQKILTLF